MAKRIEIEVNGRKYPVYSDADTPLLFVLREEIGLTGTKYGCGEGQCGACTVLIGGSPRRSCQVPLGEATQSIRTIEGLEKDGRLHSPQQAFLDQEAFRCAYCTSGMIMSGLALLEQNSNPSASEISQFMQGKFSLRFLKNPSSIHQAVLHSQGRVKFPQHRRRLSHCETLVGNP